MQQPNNAPAHEEMLEYLRSVSRNGASDLFIITGARITMKVDGRLCPLTEEKTRPAQAATLVGALYDMAHRSQEVLEATGDDDFSVSVPGLARFRVNAYRQRGSLGAVIRIVSFTIPDYRTHGIPEAVMQLADVTHGMVLIAGTAGSGKSTTQACIIDRINKTRSCHIITLEDPIEYLHSNCMSIISQREIASDTKDCVSALRACLRQAPDVIQIGEMRDLETIRAAMTAAETGHMLLATLHTRGAVNSIDRIIDTFRPEAQQQIRLQLSSVLSTVVSQQLLPGLQGELVPAFEILHMTPAVRSLIREAKTHQLNNIIATGAAQGMVSMDQAISELYRQGKITKDTALEYADDPDQLRRRLGN